MTVRPPVAQSALRVLPIALAGWTVLALLESTKDYITWLVRGAPKTWLFVLVGDFPWWYVWLALTPLMLWIARQVPVSEGTWRRTVPVHALASCLVASLHVFIAGPVYFALRAAGFQAANTLRGVWLGFFNTYFMTNILTYGSVVGGYFAWGYYRQFRQSAVESARLEAQSARLSLGLAEARMHALRMELNPHFLFNTLNAISGLVRKQETASAVGMLAKLGDLLRVTLDQDMPPEIPVCDEMALVERYLDIERVRFGSRLTIEMQIAENVSNALVPALLLQPLVENAIRHGVTKRLGSALVRVTIRRNGATLNIEVRDAGDGLANASGGQLREGIGLTNSRARLTEMYGSAATLDLSNAPGGGACVRVTMPFHTAAESERVAIGA